ncbi:MerR family transcriptional regulator [Actinophytocola oryzae]|uniref:MerR-like DNA binding protein n=1 Tax=Actinophytocola oryzae TaxID=502181 RepID=A0A4R7VNY0_9PSEU|nr:MerR family transcriptional regulator [Actinophytocola oryzae]TDV50979.1 MerR-like DNA binding protein [Actinophytocola oryzae]
MNDELWTLEQLSGRVADLLASEYDGQRNGRVRELPNGRTIRWYTTIGLVDRPSATRGRVALYGTRHALQLAAIKRLQAQGLSLAEVQERLIGTTDAELADIARTSLDIIHVPPAMQISGEKFWGHHDTDPHDDTDTVTRAVPAFRVGDSVTVLLDGSTRPLDDADIAELTAAARPLLDAIDRLGLSPRKERR